MTFNNSLLHCYCIAFNCQQNRIVAISCLQFERAGSKILCAVDYIFNLLSCAFNFLQPMKKIVFSIASRANGQLQI